MTVELTTPRIRIAKRIAAPFKGAGIGALFIFFAYGSGRLIGQVPEGDYAVEGYLRVSVYAAVVMAVAVFLRFGGDGKDLLIVDRIGVTVVDKRWIRVRDGSFTIPWALVRRIRIEPSNASHALMVEFKTYTKDDTVQWAQIRALLRCIKRDSGAADYSPRTFYDVGRLYVASGGAERTVLLHRMHKALARFGGDAYVQ
ncbi:hypothetical protein AB0392_11460 [Nonomuraea angiospora]|uniref:hypothetical protein n=1 Tax=Nonomuraea angiospora TaxID=46172 RepID=UPI00344D9CCB